MKTDELLDQILDPTARLDPRRGGILPLFGPQALQLGQGFVDADAVRAAIATRSGRWHSPAVELEALVGVTSPPIPPGVAVPPPIVSPFAYAAGRFAQGTTSAGAIPYLRESARVNAATYVAAGAAKPESDNDFTLATQPVVKLAHWLAVPDEFLDDAPGLATYLDTNLTVGLLSVLDHEALQGDGAAGHLQGLIGLAGKTPPVNATGGATGNVSAIMTAIANVWTGSRRRPDTVVINPATYALVAPGVPVAPLTAPIEFVFTPEMPTGQALVGAFGTGGMLFRRGGVVVQATNSHADYFRKNLTAIRAELRVALVYFVPAAFCLVTGIA